jgi:hypothetical protein
VQCGPDLVSKEMAPPVPVDDSTTEDAVTKEARDRIVGELRGILDRLDSLELWLAGAHLSSAIDSIEEAGAADQAPAEG